MQAKIRKLYLSGVLTLCTAVVVCMCVCVCVCVSASAHIVIGVEHTSDVFSKVTVKNSLDVVTMVNCNKACT